MEYIYFCPKCGATYGQEKNNYVKVCSDCYVETVYSGYTDEEWYKKPYAERVRMAADICGAAENQGISDDVCLDVKQRRTISEKGLTVYSDPIRLMDDETTSEFNVLQTIKNCAETFGAEIVVYQEAVERGFFDNDPIPCLRICHPEHPYDYYNFCLTRKNREKPVCFRYLHLGAADK